MGTIIALVLCVFGIAAGLILFKLASHALAPRTDVLALMTSPYLIGGGVLYVAATLDWIWLLSRLELSQAYPYASRMSG